MSVERALLHSPNFWGSALRFGLAVKVTKTIFYQGHNADAVIGLLFLITPARLDFAYHIAGVVSWVQEHQ